MDNIIVKIDLGKFTNNINLEKRMESACVYTEGEVKRMLSKPGTGRTYRRGSGYHTASAPGQPPAVDTGRLRASVTHRIESEAKGVTGYVGAPVEYAKGLELGTSKVAARPFLRPTLEMHKDQIVKEFSKG